MTDIQRKRVQNTAIVTLLHGDNKKIELTLTFWVLEKIQSLLEIISVRISQTYNFNR